MEQNPANIAQFGTHQINNTRNVIAIDTATHIEINRIYGSLRADGSMTVRDWLKTKPYAEQYEFGMQVLRELGVVK